MHGLNVITNHQRVNSEAMPQIMEAYIFYACSITDGPEMLDDSSSDEMFSQHVCEYIVFGIMPALTIDLLISELFFFFIPQGVHSNLGRDNHSAFSIFGSLYEVNTVFALKLLL